MQDRSGELIREYKLQEYVGKGAFAAVYRAEHRLLEQIRAVKIIHPEHLSDPEALQFFKAEAQVVAKLEHPHIVTLFEFWVDERGSYIVMQWMVNGTLEAQLRKTGAMEPRAVLRVLSQIAPALRLVHDNNVVHRDLKPANILFDDKYDAHLADFGLALWLRQPAIDLPSGEIVGTPAYMPPEQADSSLGKVGPQSDIYSLGVILYEMLMGKHPFSKSHPIEMILNHLRDPLPLMRDSNPNLSPQLDDVIQRATAKVPEERYPDVLSLAEAFQVAIGATYTPPFLGKTSTLSRTQTVKAAGDLSARIYTRSGSVLENPRRLVGRDELIGTVMNLLAENAHVLLHGLAGIGKTAIAGTVAARYLEAGNKQVIWIELGRQSADALFEALAQALGQYPALATAKGDERIAVIRNMLLETDALLVIDNIWNERAVLPIIRAIPQTMPLIMTSRIAVSIDGKMLDVNALTKEGALSLLSFHANHEYRGNEKAVRLCTVLGNHPYAVEMAGKRLQIYRHLTPERLLLDIQSAPHNIVVTGMLGIEEQRSVKDLLAESVDELPDKLRDLLVAMGGLFASRASLNLLAQVRGTSLDALEAELGELERNGLLQLNMDDAIPAHYRLHDLTYSYVHTMFGNQADNISPVIRGVFSFVRDHVPDYDALKFDLTNILGAARSAYYSGDEDNLIAIMRSLVVDANYLTARGPSTSALELLQAAIKAATAREDYNAAHYFNAKLGNLYFQVTAQYDLAVQAYGEALTFARLMKDLKREAITLSLVATARFKAGMDGVEEYYEQASQASQQSGDAGVMAKISDHRSFHAIAMTPPDYEAGKQFSDVAIRTLRDKGIRDEVLLSSLNNRAVCEKQLGQLDAALQTDVEAYQLAQEMNNQMWIALLSKNIGDDYHALHNQPLATEYYRIALKLAQQLGYHEVAVEIKRFVAEHNYELVDSELPENTNRT